MDDRDHSNPLLDAARNYLRRGYRPIPVPAGSKGPILKGWQSLSLDEEALPLHFNGTGNIGLLLGEPGGGLVDVDLDCPEARELAPQFLPPTAAVTGRPGAPRSHWWYVASGVRTKRHSDPVGRGAIVELRGTGAQTLVGPSVHPSGEAYDVLDGEPARVDAADLAQCVATLAEAVVIARHGELPRSDPPAPSAPPSGDDAVRRAAAYLDAMPPAISGQGGHNRAYAAATALVHGFGLDEQTALRLLLDRYNPRCEPPWSERELIHKVSDAATKPHDRPRGWLRDTTTDSALGVDLSGLLTQPDTTADSLAPNPVPVGRLVKDRPLLRPPVVHGLLREGETMNVIAAPKVGKSWLTLDLALSVATGRSWLGAYRTEPGDVLIIDNELHPETSAHRVPKVAEARSVPMRDIADRVAIDNLRGRLRSIFDLTPYFEALEPHRYKVIVLDAFYRFMPIGGDENDNGTMANIYNRIDAFADRLGCCFVLIHHSTKGSQSAKAVTDVGAGAGAQSRAADAHLVLRPHEEEGAVVLDAAVRSWPPIDPVCLRWSFPVWDADPSLDPARLKGARSRRGERSEAEQPRTMPVEVFAETLLGDGPYTRSEIRERAKVLHGLSRRTTDGLLESAEVRGLARRETMPGRGGPVAFIRSTGEGVR